MNKRVRVTIAAALMAALSVTTIGFTATAADARPSKSQRIGDGFCC